MTLGDTVSLLSKQMPGPSDYFKNVKLPSSKIKGYYMTGKVKTQDDIILQERHMVPGPTSYHQNKDRFKVYSATIGNSLREAPDVPGLVSKRSNQPGPGYYLSEKSWDMIIKKQRGTKGVPFTT